jgi:hypothetical protein
VWMAGHTTWGVAASMTTSSSFIGQGPSNMSTSPVSRKAVRPYQ